MTVRAGLSVVVAWWWGACVLQLCLPRGGAGGGVGAEAVTGGGVGRGVDVAFQRVVGRVEGQGPRDDLGDVPAQVAVVGVADAGAAEVRSWHDEARRGQGPDDREGALWAATQTVGVLADGEHA